MGIMDESGLRSFVYSINFQISQIQGRNQHCSGEKNLLLCGLRFLKKNFSSKEVERNSFCYYKILQNFEGHGHWYCWYITFSVIYTFAK